MRRGFDNEKIVHLLRIGPWAEKVRFGLTLGLTAACFLLGGGSRLDIGGLIILQPLAILIATILILLPGEMRWAAVRTPLFLLMALALVMIAQLVPLPPSLWQSLPGGDQIAVLLNAAGAGGFWRPLSLTPEVTLASLVGLSVPAAGLIAFASLPENRTHQLLPYLLLVVALSAVLSVGQVIGGPGSALYGYAVTNEGSAVGLFANRNHQALLIAMTWPMLATWATSGHVNRQRRRVRRWTSGVAAIALIPLMIVNGSRAGLVLALLSLAFSGWLLRQHFASRTRDQFTFPAFRRRAAPLGVVAIAAVVLLTMLMSRDEAIQRLYATNFSQESRVDYWPVLIRMAFDYLPFGSGFGTFDPVFRYYEPHALLKPAYLNHAHNDWLELVITGGLPAVALALSFVIWAIRRFQTQKAWRPVTTPDYYAYLAAVMITLALLASLVDYPLRTSIHALLFAFASGWLAAPTSSVDRQTLTR